MGLQTTFHAPVGRAFLGWRKNRGGLTEIVYDSGVQTRIIWRVAGPCVSESGLVEALSVAVTANRVVSSLYEELKKRAIAIEMIAD
ncbi:MAG: hypothetical protein V9G14_12000 [Cypionkella sp.]|nr:hypothetical protein [Cypionkella sp.]